MFDLTAMPVLPPIEPPPTVQLKFSQTTWRAETPRMSVAVLDTTDRGIVARGSLRQIHAWLTQYGNSWIQGSEAVWRRVH